MAITSAFQADDAGSIPAARSKRADMAQLVERTLGKGEVDGSIPSMSSILRKKRAMLAFFVFAHGSGCDVRVVRRKNLRYHGARSCVGGKLRI